jgi:hypothetical protein
MASKPIGGIQLRKLEVVDVCYRQAQDLCVRRLPHICVTTSRYLNRNPVPEQIELLC